MIWLLISALAIRNFKSSQGRVKRPTAVDAAMKCPSGELMWPARLLKSNLLGDNGRRHARRQAGWLTFLFVGAATGSFFFARIRSDPNRMVHCATDSNRDSKTATHCSSSRSVDGGQLGRLRTIIVVVDQVSRAALQATISPYTRSGSSKGSIASTLTSAFKARAATTWVYSLLTANRLTTESFSLPVRLSATSSLCTWV